MTKNLQNADKSLEGQEIVEVFQDLDRTAVRSERFIERYARPIAWGFGIVIIGLLAWFAYLQFVVAPQNEKATIQYLNAQKNLSEGKEKEALGAKTGLNSGFLGTFEKYGQTAAGKLSAYNASLLEFKKGNYAKSYELMDHFSSDNKILMALKYGVMADTKANLGDAKAASDLLDKAISASSDQATITWMTRKAGILALNRGDKEAAKRYFMNIEESYQDYDAGMSDVFIEQVKQF